MPSIESDIQQILHLAPDFSPVPTPAMRHRATILVDLAANLESALEGPAGRPWRAALSLHVQARGQQGSVALVPWVRVYSPQYAPTAQKGIYLTYLFAADGSRAYLSLMHGSSEYRSGSMRAITDRRILLTRAAVARSTLGDLIEADGAAGATLSIDLKWRGFRNPDRAKAYEDANILAREYLSGRIPPDGQLLADFYGMLPLLGRLYDAAPVTDSVELSASGAGDSTPTKPAALVQGRVTDPELRAMIERRAEDHAVEHFEGLGWQVARVGRFKLGYDLECTKAESAVLHVEVKGTRTLGEKTFLTANEVDHARQAAKCGAEHLLYVVSQIEVSNEGGIRCSGGQARCLWPWNISNEDLTPIEYVYTLPKSPHHGQQATQGR
jgi:hypothetical protein